MVAFAVLLRRTDASAGEEETAVWRSSPGRYTGEPEPTLTRESAATNNVTTCEPAATQHVNFCEAFAFRSYIRITPGYNHIESSGEHYFTFYCTLTLFNYDDKAFRNSE